MAKIIYRLDLTLNELDEIRNKLDADLINKFKEIEITEKKIDSMKRASSKKSELTRIRFVNGLLDLQKKEIEPTQYNLRKYKNISYPTSKKYFELLEIAKKNITEISSIEEHYVLDETIEHEDDKRCIYELEKFLLEQKKKKN
jgi:hypothetical protein